MLPRITATCVLLLCPVIPFQPPQTQDPTHPSAMRRPAHPRSRELIDGDAMLACVGRVHGSTSSPASRSGSRRFCRTAAWRCVDVAILHSFDDSRNAYTADRSFLAPELRLPSRCIGQSALRLCQPVAAVVSGGGGGGGAALTSNTACRGLSSRNCSCRDPCWCFPSSPRWQWRTSRLERNWSGK